MNPIPHHPARFHSYLLAIFTSLLAFSNYALAQQAGTSPVKIFILADHSNMLGQEEMSPVTSPGTLAYTVLNDSARRCHFFHRWRRQLESRHRPHHQHATLMETVSNQLTHHQIILQ